MKFGPILVCCMTNISNMFLAGCWRLETSPRIFYDFIKMTIWRNLAIFNGCHLPFLIVPYSPFQKNETLESWHDWLLSYWSRLLNWKGPGTKRQSCKSFKSLQKNITLAYIYQLTNFGGFMSCGSKDIFKNAPCPCTNTHHDVRDLLNRGIVKNTKTWISWEQKITFLRNKQILKLCLR